MEGSSFNLISAGSGPQSRDPLVRVLNASLTTIGTFVTRNSGYESNSLTWKGYDINVDIIMCWNCLRSSKSPKPGDDKDGGDEPDAREPQPARVVHSSQTRYVAPVSDPSVSLPQKKAIGKQNESSECTMNESTSLWKTAYDLLKEQEPALVDDLENVIKFDATISLEIDVKEQMSAVAIAQREKMESKQWSFPWFGMTLKVRDIVDNIFSLIDKSQSLIATGMNFAPIYASIPWTAVAALIPVSTKRSTVFNFTCFAD